MALADAFGVLKKKNLLTAAPLKDTVAAISAGMIGGKVFLDLTYEEDSQAEVDMNFIMTGSGGLVEVQGTAERNPFTEENLQGMLTSAKKAILMLTAIQKKSLGNLRGLWQ